MGRDARNATRRVLEARLREIYARLFQPRDGGSEIARVHRQVREGRAARRKVQHRRALDESATTHFAVREHAQRLRIAMATVDRNASRKRDRHHVEHPVGERRTAGIAKRQIGLGRGCRERNEVVHGARSLASAPRAL